MLNYSNWILPAVVLPLLYVMQMCHLALSRCYNVSRNSNPALSHLRILPLQHSQVFFTCRPSVEAVSHGPRGCRLPKGQWLRLVVEMWADFHRSRSWNSCPDSFTAAAWRQFGEYNSADCQLHINARKHFNQCQVTSPASWCRPQRCN